MQYVGIMTDNLLYLLHGICSMQISLPGFECLITIIPRRSVSLLPTLLNMVFLKGGTFHAEFTFKVNNREVYKS